MLCIMAQQCKVMNLWVQAFRRVAPDALLITEGDNLQRAAEELVHLVAQPLPQICRLPHGGAHLLWPHDARIQSSLQSSHMRA